MTGTSTLTLPVPAPSTSSPAGAQFRPPHRPGRTEPSSRTPDNFAELSASGKQVELTETIVERRILVSDPPPPPPVRAVGASTVPAADPASNIAPVLPHSTGGYRGNHPNIQIQSPHLHHRARAAYTTAGASAPPDTTARLDLMA